METEVGIMLPQTRNAKDYQQLPDTRRVKERFFPTAFRGSRALLTL